MFISRKAYDDLRLEAAVVNASNKELNQRIAAQDTSMAWMSARLTQIEHERAQLLFNYTGVKIAAPRIETSAPTPSMGAQEAVQSMGLFNDLGDDLAGKLGIEWGEDGAVTYRKQT